MARAESTCFAGAQSLTRPREVLGRAGGVCCRVRDVCSSWNASQPRSASPLCSVLHMQARRLEGEIDVKLAAFTKLCSSFEASYKLNSADSSLGADQVSEELECEPPCPLEHLHALAMGAR